MNHQPQHHARRVVARRSAVLLTAVLAIGGTPLVARALGDDIAPQAAQVIEVDTTGPVDIAALAAAVRAALDDEDAPGG